MRHGSKSEAFMVERMRIHPGGRLVLFTDGLTESRDLQGKEFGQIRSSKG